MTNYARGENAAQRLTIGNDCICIGTDAGADLIGQDRVIEMNFAGIGLRRAVMTAEEAPIVRAVVLRMMEEDIKWAVGGGRGIDTRGSGSGSGSGSSSSS